MRRELEVESPEEREASPWSRWWGGLEHRRGDRAALRRAQSILDVAVEPAFHDLLRRLGSRLKEADRDRVAVAAGLLARIKRDAGDRSLPELMGRLKGDKPVVSDLRFRRLLRLESSEELLRELGRVVQMLDGEAPVTQLANDVIRWGDPVRKRWALSYYAQAETNLHK